MPSLPTNQVSALPTLEVGRFRFIKKSRFRFLGHFRHILRNWNQNWNKKICQRDKKGIVFRFTIPQFTNRQKESRFTTPDFEEIDPPLGHTYQQWRLCRPTFQIRPLLQTRLKTLKKENVCNFYLPQKRPSLYYVHKICLTLTPLPYVGKFEVFLNLLLHLCGRHIRMAPN